MKIWAAAALGSLCFVFSPAVSRAATQELSLAPTSLEFRIGLHGNSADSAVTQSRVAGTEVRGLLNHRFMPSLEAKAVGEVWLEEGSSQALFSEEFKPRQQPRLREATVNWTGLSFLHLSGGVLDQEMWTLPMVFSRVSYPGVVERLQYGGKIARVRLEMQQSIASQGANSYLTSNQFDGTATFYMERLGVDGSSLDTKWDLHASHYSFGSLSPMTAFQSRFLGNSVSGLGANGSRFDYGFGVFEVGAAGSLAVGNVTAELQLNTLWNQDAPEGTNRAHYARLQVPFGISTNLRLAPSVEAFRVESDVTPAAFSDRRLGHNNRHGYGLGMAVEWPVSGFRAGLEWDRANVLDANPFQSDLNWVRLYFQTTYRAI